MQKDVQGLCVYNKNEMELYSSGAWIFSHLLPCPYRKRAESFRICFPFTNALLLEGWGRGRGILPGSSAPSAPARPIVPRLRPGSLHHQPLAGATRRDFKVLLVQAGRGERREIQQDR